ncbi:hypothetical protein [Thalassospira tepidiphila]|uniref:hypothetical protein n=1 Tax=Thalassospira tepidiphila TaxID=393657 RepID=UPI0030C670F8
MKKLKSLCKAHWNPSGVLLIGILSGSALTLAFFGNNEELGGLERWQSLIGVLISTAFALGLFQIQRSIDLADAMESRISVANNVLRQIGNTFNESFFDQIIAEMQTNKVRLESFSGEADSIRPEFIKSANDLIQLQTICSQVLNFISTIPKDQHLPHRTIEEITTAEGTLIWWDKVSVGVLNGINNPNTSIDEMKARYSELIELTVGLQVIVTKLSKHVSKNS